MIRKLQNLRLCSNVCVCVATIHKRINGLVMLHPLQVAVLALALPFLMVSCTQLVDKMVSNVLITSNDTIQRKTSGQRYFLVNIHTQDN